MRAEHSLSSFFHQQFSSRQVSVRNCVAIRPHFPEKCAYAVSAFSGEAYFSDQLHKPPREEFLITWVAYLLTLQGCFCTSLNRASETRR